VNIVYVSRVQMNPYVELLARGVESAAPEARCAVRDSLTPGWLWRQRREVDVLHLHWVELLYASATRKGLWVRWLGFVGALLLAKALGIRIAYTVHNIEHHEGKHAALNRLTNGLVFRLADVVHVHDEHARRAVAEQLHRRRGVATIPHGNYFSYPNVCSREQARARLGLPAGAYTYLFLGQIRPYKGVEDLLQAMAGLEAPDARLIIAGNAHEPAYGAEIAALAARDPRVMLVAQFVPAEDVQYFMNACDICVLPYRHVTTSGAAILAFSFGKPVIAPRLGGFAELLAEGRGLLYEPGDIGGLREALRQALTMDLEAAGAAAWAMARQLDWTAIGGQHWRAYQAARGQRAR